MAIAVFTSTASHPISIAIAASDGFPIPASTMIGTLLFSNNISTNGFVSIPLFEPIGEPSGITAAAPASSSLLAVIKSGIIYGSTINPSSAKTFVAFIVSLLSGIRYLLSFIISIFIKSPHPASLAILAIFIASSAVLAPEVLGNSVMCFGI